MFKTERGFTLIEMLIVLLIIAVLILLIVPTIGKRSENVHEQGCEALVLTVQTQADAFRLEKGSYPATIEELEKNKFITDNQIKCKSDHELTINDEGVVSVQENKK